MSYESSMLNTVCKTYSNGSRCVNCEMKNDDTRKSDYVGIRPKTDLDNFRKQVALCINVTLINHLGIRQIWLCSMPDELSLCHHRREEFGFCGMDCNQKHNLMSTLAFLPIQFRTTIDDTMHWPHQNYEKDHVCNVRRHKCGCSSEWKEDFKFHDIHMCRWLSGTGDVICSEYSKDTSYSLNRIRSYCDLAIKATCRCIPSQSLLKHGALEYRHHTHFGQMTNSGVCDFGLANCRTYCSSCVHYCSVQHGA